MITFASLRLLGLALFISAAAAVGCGRKAPPRAPDDVLPKSIVDLSASNTAKGIELAWTRPRVYADGSDMPDLGGFVIERAALTAPRPTFQRLAVVEVTDRDRFRQLKRFRFVDRETAPGVAYSYRVVSFTIDRYFSEPSNIVTVERAMTGEDSHASFSAPPR